MDYHPIHKASHPLNHHPLLVGSLSMSVWIILVGRLHLWLQLQDDYDLGQQKGGGAMEGSRQRINSKNASPKSCGQRSNKLKEKQQELGQS